MVPKPTPEERLLLQIGALSGPEMVAGPFPPANH
jgi:hypothetical protein